MRCYWGGAGSRLVMSNTYTVKVYEQRRGVVALVGLVRGLPLSDAVRRGGREEKGGRWVTIGREDA
jgi:hypothetical protein